MVETILQSRGMHKFIDGYRGELWRKSQLSGAWKKRYFILEAKKIKCFDDATCDKLVSEFAVYNDIVLYDIPGSAENMNFLFYFSGGGDDVYYLSAESDETKQNWLEAITDAKRNGFKLINLPKLAIEPFYPTIDLCLSFQNETYFANNENRLLPANIQDPPAVTLRFGNEHSIYTLVMIDLDSIRTSFEPNASYLHWAIVNIEGTDISSGLEISHYESPSPEYDSGMHRFMFLLFNQSSDFTPDEFDALDEMFSHRGNFSHMELMQRFHLGAPVGINGFYAAWDDNCDRLHEEMGYTPPAEYFSHKQAAIAEKTRTENARKALFQDFTLNDVFPSSEVDPTVVPALGTIALRIRYDRDHIVHDGLAIPPEFTKKQPNVSYIPHPVESEEDCGLYTLLLVDPDAPSRINHSLREHVSWAVVNIPQDKVTAGETLLAYQAPAPSYASGLHRYIFCLYKQKMAFTHTQVEENQAFFAKRSGILTYTWVKSQNTVLESVPVSLEAFLSEWDKSVDELHRAMGYTPPLQYCSPAQKRQALASTAQKSTSSMFSPRHGEVDDITLRLKKIQEAHQTFNTTVTDTSTRMTDLEVELEGKKRLEIKDAVEESTAMVPHTGNSSPASRLEQGPASKAPSGPSSGAKKGPPRGPITLSAATKTISSAQNSPINLHALDGNTEAQSAAAAAAALNSTDDAQVVQQSRQESSKNTTASSQRAEYNTEHTGHTKTSTLKKQQRSDGQVSEERTEEEKEEKHQERSEKMTEEHSTNETGLHSTSVRDYSPDAQNSPLSAVTMLKQEQGIQEEGRRLQEAQVQQRQQELLERQRQEMELQENARRAQEEKVLKQQQDTMERQKRAQEEDKEQDKQMRDYNKPYRAPRQQGKGKEFFSALPDSEYSDTDASAYDSSSVFSGPTPTGRYGYLQPQHSGSNAGRPLLSMSSQQQSQGHAARGAVLTPEADDSSQTENSDTSGPSGNQQRNHKGSSPTENTPASAASSKLSPSKLSSDPNTRLQQIYEGVVQAKSTSDLCELFGITTQSVFSGEKMKKKLSNDFLSKDSFIWVSPRTRSLHWCKTKGDASDSKFLLLDPVSGADPGVPPKGELKGTVKRVRVSGPNLLVTMESGEFLELKLSAEGTPAAVTRAADWATVIKAFSPSSS